MAEIVQGLFGVSPESLNAQREQALQAQALQYAQLDPSQQAQMGFYQAGSRLGTGLAGLMGAQDPEMQRVTQRQQMLKSINPNDPESLKQGIQAAMQGGDYQLASTLNTQYQTAAKAALDARKTEAEISTKVGERSTNEMKNAAARADASGAVRGTPEWTEAYKTILEEQTTKPEKTMSYGPQAEIASKALYGKSFNNLTQEQAAVVDKELESRGIKKAQSGAARINNVVGKDAGDIMGLRREINTTLKPYRDAVNSANTAIILADDVLKTGNFASANALSRSLISASGDTQISNKDISSYGGDPSLVGRVADIASNLVTGVPTADSIKKLRALAVLLKKKNEALEKTEIKQLQNTARASKQFDEEQIQTIFTLRGDTQKKGTFKTASGVSYTVED